MVAHGRGAGDAQRLTPCDDDESGDEGYDTFRSSSADSSSAMQQQNPPPAPPPSVPRPSWIRMVGTVLPQDSMRGNRTRASGGRFGGGSEQTKHVVSNAKLFAAAGLDLFRQGLAFDGLQPCRQAPRHPAVTPNLNPILEDEDAHDESGSVSTDSQVIVVHGSGPLKSGGELSACVANRVEKASELYWEITRAFAEQQANSHCYLVPMADESGNDGVLECEAIRNALAASGISPHHIVMDCSAPNMAENTVLLVPVLRHLHIELVHVVTSELQLKRATACVDGILGAAPDMSFKILYHTAPDGYSNNNARALSIRKKLEDRNLYRAIPAIDDAIGRQRKHLQPKSYYSNNKPRDVHSTRAATRIGSHGSTALIFSNDPRSSCYGV